MRIRRIALVAFVIADAALAQQGPRDRAASTDPRDEAAKALVGRLDLERYKATIKGLTQFGDRRQGTERNRKAVQGYERMAVKAKVPIEQRELGRDELDWDGREDAKKGAT